MRTHEHIKQMIVNYTRRLQALKERQALLGHDAELGIGLEIEDIETKINKLRLELKEIEDRLGTAGQTKVVSPLDAAHLDQQGVIGHLAGKKLGKYVLVSQLGQGGMAKVYKAYHPNLERYVAIKTMHSHLSAKKQFIKRFMREATAVARLRHPNIVQIYDFDYDNDVYYIVMEFIDGPTLQSKLRARRIRAQQLSFTEVANIFQMVAGAVDYAHARGMIHRDLKPANIMFTPEGQAVLTDFGIAHLVHGTQYTAEGAHIGTPAYMSPEQCRGEPIDGRSDIYSLGIILFECVTGHIPFETQTPQGLIFKHIMEPPPTPPTLTRPFPPPLKP